MPTYSSKDPEQRSKLAHSYSELLDEFSSQELRHVGNYTLGKLIGKGSFGKVYLATHKLTNGTKVVLKSANRDDANLSREIHHHRQFVHPHIARLYEVIVTEKLVWLVLEYCAGDELYNHLLQHGRFEPAKAQKIFTQLVGAVSFVHQRSCVHRDLKLENILLDKQENVKLVDFGFTREYEGKSSYLQTWCGTVCYSAPEMLKGEKYAGEKVDVWSLGIILYALLCGELPFDEDDEEATKMRILRDEPKYPDHIPEPAKDLLTRLLSKRSLLRPCLADVMRHEWLSDHAPQQIAILQIQQPAPFTTEIEKETLHRMKAAGVNIDTVIENVLAQRCDSLAGWWAILIEKEERKAKRREQKRKEREAETKSIRRLSAASNRSGRLGPTIREADDGMYTGPHLLVNGTDAMRGRPRNSRRISDSVLPSVVEVITNSKDPDPTTPKKDASTTAGHTEPSKASSPAKPTPPPKEKLKESPAAMQTASGAPDTTVAPTLQSRPKPPSFLLSPLASFRRWIKDPTGRSKGANRNDAQSPSRRPISKQTLAARRTSMASVSSYRYSNSHMQPGSRGQHGVSPLRPLPNITTTASSRRPSLSPLHSQHGSQRRISANLRGRKSTSSSLSSIRSAHPHPSHTRASSASSTAASIASPTAATMARLGRSPHTSVKVLPSTPTATTFPSNVRLVRGGGSSEAGAVFNNLPPPSPGMIFARRKRSPFKGPMLSLDMHGLSGTGLGRSRAKSGSRSGSVQGRPSQDAIEEEEEDEEEEAGFETTEDLTPSNELPTFLESTPTSPALEIDASQLHDFSQGMNGGGVPRHH